MEWSINVIIIITIIIIIIITNAALLKFVAYFSASMFDGSVPPYISYVKEFINYVQAAKGFEPAATENNSEKHTTPRSFLQPTCEYHFFTYTLPVGQNTINFI